MNEFNPDDRVLVTTDCLPDGGMLGTISQGFLTLDGECTHKTSVWFISSDTFNFLHKDLQMVLHYRPKRPRPPDPEPFTRSNGHRVSWITWGGSAWYPSYSRALTPDDARRLAAGYERIADILEWEKEND